MKKLIIKNILWNFLKTYTQIRARVNPIRIEGKVKTI